jgi:hypothetical protein
MGSKSEGPLLVLWNIENPANRVVVNAQNAFSPSDPRVWAGLLDPNSLTFLEIGSFGVSGPWANNGPPLASKDGRWFVPIPNLLRFPAGANVAREIGGNRCPLGRNWCQCAP